MPDMFGSRRGIWGESTLGRTEGRKWRAVGAASASLANPARLTGHIGGAYGLAATATFEATATASVDPPFGAMAGVARSMRLHIERRIT